MKALYLGDAVYAKLNPEFDELVLTTDSHIDGEAGNRIVLGPKEVQSLLEFLKNPAMGDDV